MSKLCTMSELLIASTGSTLSFTLTPQVEFLTASYEMMQDAIRITKKEIQNNVKQIFLSRIHDGSIRNGTSSSYVRLVVIKQLEGKRKKKKIIVNLIRKQAIEKSRKDSMTIENLWMPHDVLQSSIQW